MANAGAVGWQSGLAVVPLAILMPARRAYVPPRDPGGNSDRPHPWRQPTPPRIASPTKADSVTAVSSLPSNPVRWRCVGEGLAGHDDLGYARAVFLRYFRSPTFFCGYRQDPSGAFTSQRGSKDRTRDDPNDQGSDVASSQVKPSRRPLYATGVPAIWRWLPRHRRAELDGDYNHYDHVHIATDGGDTQPAGNLLSDPWFYVARTSNATTKRSSPRFPPGMATSLRAASPLNEVVRGEQA